MTIDILEYKSPLIRLRPEEYFEIEMINMYPSGAVVHIASMGNREMSVLGYYSAGPEWVEIRRSLQGTSFVVRRKG